MTAAQRRALDFLRHRKMAQGHDEAMAQDRRARGEDRTPDASAGLDARWRDDAGEVVDDDLLRLIFCACHPVLLPPARVALTLKVVAGLSTEEIARAYLVPETTLAQRLVRAKRTLAEAQVGFELPDREARAERMSTVLEVVYLIFNEGYAATGGEDWMRPDLCEEALRLGRLLVRLAPGSSEAWGLLALMELQSSRAPARIDAQGQAVRLAQQDRGRWDTARIDRGLAALAQSRREAPGAQAGSYQLQAEIAACHARAPSVEATDWAEISARYGQLMAVAPSPVVALNRAVAVSMHAGPEAALVQVDALRDDPHLQRTHWLVAVRADLLERLGRREEARAAFLEASGLAANGSERSLLAARAKALET